MLRPETPQAAADAAADVADEVTGDTPDNEAGSRALLTPSDGGAPDASRDELTDPSWEADRATELDPGRVHGDDLQSDATRSEGEPTVRAPSPPQPATTSSDWLGSFGTTLGSGEGDSPARRLGTITEGARPERPSVAPQVVRAEPDEPRGTGIGGAAARVRDELSLTGSSEERIDLVPIGH